MTGGVPRERLGRMVLLALLLTGAVLAAAVVAAPALAAQRGEVVPPDYVLEEDGTVVVEGDQATDCPSFAGGLEDGVFFGGIDPEQARIVVERCRQGGFLPSDGSATVSARPSGSEGGVEATASSPEVYEYHGSPPSEEPIVVENGELRGDGDIRIGCRSDYRVLGERQSRACYEAGHAPLDYPGPDAEGPFPPYPDPAEPDPAEGAAADASPTTELPDTGGAAPAILGAGALVATVGFLVRRVRV